MIEPWNCTSRLRNLGQIRSTIEESETGHRGERATGLCKHSPPSLTPWGYAVGSTLTPLEDDNCVGTPAERRAHANLTSQRAERLEGKPHPIRVPVRLDSALRVNGLRFRTEDGRLIAGVFSRGIHR